MNQPRASSISSLRPLCALRTLRLKAALLALQALILTSCAAFEFDKAKLAEIDTAIGSAVVEGKCPGAVFWLEHEGEKYAQIYGCRALVPDKEEMTADTIFDAASLTKVLATTPSILLLIERAKVQLDSPVSVYIPEFTGEGRENVRVRHLLTHVSGLRPDIDYNFKGYDVGIGKACAEKLTGAPETKFTYSDINFILLGEIVRRVSHKPLNEFAAAEIFAPLKMIDTGFLPHTDKHARIAPTTEVNHVMLRGEVHDPSSRLMGGIAGHAGVFTTAADVARYARMLVNGGELEGIRIFQPETVKLMTSIQSPEALKDKRGLGWDIDSGYSRPRGKIFPQGISYGHTGFTGTCLWIDPQSKTFYILLTNRVHPEGKGNILGLQATLGTLAAEAAGLK